MTIVSTSNTGIMGKRDEMSNCHAYKINSLNIAIADLIEYEDGKMITRINVPAKFRGKGCGSRLLCAILEDADKYNVPLYLQIMPSGGLSHDELESWYLRHGFKCYGSFYKRGPRTSNLEGIVFKNIESQYKKDGLHAIHKIKE